MPEAFRFNKGMVPYQPGMDERPVVADLDPLAGVLLHRLVLGVGRLHQHAWQLPGLRHMAANCDGHIRAGVVGLVTRRPLIK